MNTDVDGATYGPWAIRRDAEGRLRVARIAEEPDWSVVAPGATVEARDPDGLLVSAEVVERTEAGIVLATRGVGGRRVVWAQVAKSAQNGNAEPGSTVYVSRAFSPTLLGEPSFVLPLRTPVQVVGFAGPEQDEEYFGVSLPGKGVRTLGEVTLVSTIGRFPAGSTVILPFTEAEISGFMRAGKDNAPQSPIPRVVAPGRDPTQVRGDSAFDWERDQKGWEGLPGAEFKPEKPGPVKSGSRQVIAAEFKASKRGDRVNPHVYLFILRNGGEVTERVVRTDRPGAGNSFHEHKREELRVGKSIRPIAVDFGKGWEVADPEQYDFWNKEQLQYVEDSWGGGAPEAGGGGGGASERVAAAKYDKINFSPPEGVRKAARRGLDLRSEHGRGGTSVGIARARDLANGKNVSPSTIRRMKAFFDRHQKNRSDGKESPPTNGYIAWLLWGGDPGRAWAEKIVRQMDSADAA